MAERTQWGLIGGLLLLTALFALLLSPDGARSSLDPRASTFRATPNGTLALYLLLEELEVPVGRRLSPYVDGEPLPAAMAVVAPTQAASPAEVGALLEWVRDGGRLLYVASRGDTLLDALGLVLERAGRDSAASTAMWPTAATFPAHPLAEGMDSVAGFRQVFADSSAALAAAGATTLLRDARGRAAVLRWRLGEGAVVAWSDRAPLVNQWIEESGGAVLFARLARELAGDAGDGRIEFDEYHHGFTGDGSPAGALLGFVRDTPAGRMSLQLAVAGAGLLLLLGTRFGAPLPPARGRRRSPLEHLDALAAAYREGRARGRARHLLVAGLARRIGRRPPSPGAERQFLAALTAGATSRREAAEALLTAWDADGASADLTNLARRADDLVTERKGT